MKQTPKQATIIGLLAFENSRDWRHISNSKRIRRIRLVLLIEY